LRESEITQAKLGGGDYVSCQIWVDSHPGFDFMLPDDFKNIQTLKMSESIPDWDLEAYLDVQRAIKLAYPTKRSLLEGFGLLIGSNPKTMFPKKLASTDIDDREPNISIIYTADRPKEFWDDLRQLLTFNFEGFKVNYIFESDIQSLFECIKMSAAVIGRQGIGTYMAAAQRKVTVEYCLGDYSSFLSKFENPFYSLVMVENTHEGLEKLTPTLLFRSFQARAQNARMKERVKK